MDQNMIAQFLALAGVDRAQRAFRKLSQHDTSRWALTGRLAIEYHCLRHGVRSMLGNLNDIDFVASAFDHIPGTLAHDYLFRHIHPLDPPNKTLIQFVDTDCALRVDVFRTTDQVMRRAEHVDLGFGPIAVVSLEDMTARSARLAMSVAEGKPVAPKHVTDYLRLVEIADLDKLETAWEDHRRPTDPIVFHEIQSLLQGLIPARPDLQIPTVHSRNTTTVCPRCASVPPLQLADPSTVLSVLDYC